MILTYVVLEIGDRKIVYFQSISGISGLSTTVITTYFMLSYFFCWNFPQKNIAFRTIYVPIQDPSPCFLHLQQPSPELRQVQPVKVLPAAKVRGGTDLIIVRNVDKVPELQRWEKAKAALGPEGDGDGHW